MLLAAVVLTLSAGWVSIVGGVIVPVLTGLVTRMGATSPGVKGLLTVLLSAVLAVVTAVIQGNGVLDTETLIQGAVTLGVSVLWLYNIHLPFQLDQYLLPSKALPGLGGPDVESTGGI